VISNPDLSIPPEFDLQNPYKDHDNITVISPTPGKPHSDHLSIADKEFLDSLGQNPATQSKTDFDKDLKADKKENEVGIIRKKLSTLSGANEEPVIDPVAEKERIQENLSNDLPINEGEVQDRKKSTIDRILE
jgi:hypothetical protein